MSDIRARILVADDDTNLLELLTDTLATLGYDVTGVCDGIQALEKLKQERYDLMISNIRMPGIDGIDLLERARRYYPRMPVLFITGIATPEVIGRASPDGFLAKPFRISHMEELIENALAGRGEKVDNPIRRVMIVDDDDSFREVLSDMLRANDYVPLAVSNGPEALKELESGGIDAVVTDIKMPGMDGIELLRKIKAQSPDMPVVLITGFYSAQDVSGGASQVSADGFLEKPFRAENIVKLLRELALQPAGDSG